MSFIQAENLKLVFDSKDGEVTALNNVNFKIEKGDFVSFIGPSGCGKTSLLRIIADLEKPTLGKISIQQQNPQEFREKRQYGYVFQSPVLYSWRTVEKNVLLPLEIFGVPKKERIKRAKESLASVGLQGFEKKYPWQLSGGMQQRVSIARALSFQVELLLMDEPFGALDAITREDLNEQLYELWKQTKKTVLFVTHSVAEAVYLSNKIFVFSQRPGTIAEIISTNKKENKKNLRDSAEFNHLCSKVRHSLNQAGKQNG